MKNKEKKKDKDKEKEKVNKKKRSLIIDIFFIILSSISSAYLIHSLLLLGQIEKLIRFIIIGLVCLLEIVMIVNLFRRNKKKRRIKKSIKRFLLTILMIIYIIVGYAVSYTHETIKGLNKKYVTYSTALVTLVTNKVDDPNDINGAIIGTGSDKEDQQLYILPHQIIEKYSLDKDNKIVEYEDEPSLIAALYDGEVDYIFLQANYASVYANYEEYETLEDDTKIIDSDSKQEEKDDAGLQGSSKDLSEPITILLLGVDSKANGIKNADSFNGDAMILVTFNPKTLKATMLSIPRDSYVPISCFPNQTENKITHAAARGTKCAINTIQNYFGITIDYYVKINFTGLVDLVNIVGGIDVDVPYSLCEQNSKRKWGSSTVYVDAGKQHLNGEQALALSRNRHKPNDGTKVGKKMAEYCPDRKSGTRNDFVRGQNQQAVIKGILDQLKKIKDFNTVKDILDSISSNMDTNMSVDTILSFYNVGKDIITTSHKEDGEVITIQKLYLAGSDQRIYDERSKLVLYNYIPNQESKELITNAMKENLGLVKSTTKVTNFSYSIEDYYEANVIGRYPKTSTKLYTLIPNFKTYTKTKALEWGTKNGFTIIFDEVEDTKYTDGTIIEQSYPEKKRTDLCNPKTVTLKIVNNKTTTPPPVEEKPPAEEDDDQTGDEKEEDQDQSTEEKDKGDTEEKDKEDTPTDQESNP